MTDAEAPLGIEAYIVKTNDLSPADASRLATAIEGAMALWQCPTEGDGLPPFFIEGDPNVPNTHRLGGFLMAAALHRGGTLFPRASTDAWGLGDLESPLA